MADDFLAQLSCEDRQAQYVPTPVDIEARAAAIRGRWSPRQLLVRAGVAPEVEIQQFGTKGRRRVSSIGRD